MLTNIFFVIATFTAPENIGTSTWSMLWLLPLTASIAIVYKATKLPKIQAANFIRESLLLFGSIMVFMVITALVLLVFARLTIE